MLSCGGDAGKAYFGWAKAVRGVLRPVTDGPAATSADCACCPRASRGATVAPAQMSLLTRVSTSRVPGLPDVDVRLQPMTALIGARASGKSRLLAAVSWLLSGRPLLAPAGTDPPPMVTAELETHGGRLTLVRGAGPAPDGPLPRVTYYPAVDRLARPPVGPLAIGWSDAARAEQMVEAIAQATRDDTSGDVLLIEEPELMLTPQTQRYLYRLLRDIAEQNQVIYSTRAPALLDAVHHAEIVRLGVGGQLGAVRQAPPDLLTDEQRLRLAAEFDHERSEMFFATAVVLVEGQTERQSLPLVFRSLGHDPDALGISITEVGGKGNLTLASRLLTELEIPHVIVFDSDRGAPGEALNAEICRGPAPCFALDPNFEAVAGIGTGEEKVLNAWRRFNDADPDDLPLVFRRVVETAVGLAAA
jgi:hypothetical protein